MLARDVLAPKKEMNIIFRIWLQGTARTTLVVRNCQLSDQIII